MTRMLLALLLVAVVPSFVLGRRHGDYNDAGRAMRTLLQTSAAGTNQLTQAEADSLVGVWTLQDDSIHFFSPQLAFLAAGLQYNSSGSVNATQAFQSGFNVSALLASMSRGNSSLANANISQFLGELVIIGADPATGIFAGVVVLGNASSGTIYRATTIIGTTIKSGEVITLSGNDQSPEFAFTGIVSNGTLNFQAQNNLDLDIGDDSVDVTYITQAAFDKSPNVTVDSVLNAIYKSAKGYNGNHSNGNDNDNNDDDKSRK